MLAGPITRIVNISLATGEFPHRFKRALVTPLIKKPSLDCTDLKNYRPVSNLSFISKVIEKVAAARLNTYLHDHQLHETLQSAYKAHHSVETALLKVHNDIMCALDSKKAVLLILLDLSAAFDTSDHGILLERLQHGFGIQGLALQWFSSYLHGRHQDVYIQGVASDEVSLNYGVPQGSVLGPVLFTLSTTPLKQIAAQHGLLAHFYADDSTLHRI